MARDYRRGLALPRAFAARRVPYEPCDDASEDRETVPVRRAGTSARRSRRAGDGGAPDRGARLRGAVLVRPHRWRGSVHPADGGRRGDDPPEDRSPGAQQRVPPSGAWWLARRRPSIGSLVGGWCSGWAPGTRRTEHDAIGLVLREPGPRVDRFEESVIALRSLLDTGAAELDGDAPPAPPRRPRHSARAGASAVPDRRVRQTGRGRRGPARRHLPVHRIDRRRRWSTDGSGVRHRGRQGTIAMVGRCGGCTDGRHRAVGARSGHRHQ